MELTGHQLVGGTAQLCLRPVHSHARHTTSFKGQQTLTASRLAALELQWGSTAFRSSRGRALQQPRALHQDRSLLNADLYALVAISLAYQVLASTSEPGFSWLQPPRAHPHTAAVFLQLSCTALISWLASNLAVGGFQAGVSADLKETFRRTLLAFLIALPLTSAQLEISHWASGWTAVSACNSRRVAGILGAMCLWRIGFAVNAEAWDLAFYRFDDVAPEQRRALVSIACAVGVFIVTWHTMMGLLHSGAASEFAASLVKSPGSLLE